MREKAVMGGQMERHGWMGYVRCRTELVDRLNVGSEEKVIIKEDSWGLGLSN